jgi:hypothetical protein
MFIFTTLQKMTIDNKHIASLLNASASLIAIAVIVLIIISSTPPGVQLTY